jgi:hypothetical protein
LTVTVTTAGAWMSVVPLIAGVVSFAKAVAPPASDSAGGAL